MQREARSIGMKQVRKEEKALNHDPLMEAAQILSEDFYGLRTKDKQPSQERVKKPKPSHYKVICISLYNKDIEKLETTVAELKRRGYTKANKSQLIRLALSQVDIDKLPPPSALG